MKILNVSSFVLKLSTKGSNCVHSKFYVHCGRREVVGYKGTVMVKSEHNISVKEYNNKEFYNKNFDLRLKIKHWYQLYQ